MVLLFGASFVFVPHPHLCDTHIHIAFVFVFVFLFVFTFVFVPHLCHTHSHCDTSCRHTFSALCHSLSQVNVINTDKCFEPHQTENTMFKINLTLFFVFFLCFFGFLLLANPISLKPAATIRILVISFRLSFLIFAAFKCSQICHQRPYIYVG